MIDSHLKPQYSMIMSKLYDTGYNLTNLVEEDWNKNQCPSIFILGHVCMNCTICWQTKFGTPYIVFN